MNKPRKKSGMHLDQVCKIVREMRARIDGMIAATIHYRRTHQELLDRREKEIFQDPHWRKLPQWAVHEVQAYFHGKSDMISRYLTVFAYRAIEDGRLYATSPSLKVVPSCMMPTWDELQAKHGKFDDTMWDQNGAYWPCGLPFSTHVNTKIVAVEPAPEVS